MSLRITAPSSDGRPRRGPGGHAIESDPYMSRLVKLVPGEAIAVYPMVHNRAIDTVEAVQRSATDKMDEVRRAADAAAPQAGDLITKAASTGAEWLPIAITWAVLLCVIILRWHATRGPNGDAQWGAVAIAAVTFCLLVPTMNGSFGIMQLASSLNWISWHKEVQDFLPEILLTFWTILIPAFYKPEN